MSIETTEIAPIETADLENVTGGFAWGPLITQGLSMLGGLMGRTNIGVQNGNNQRSAQGNTGPVSLGDGSPITTSGGDK
ncbi:MAG TPA: hypothetical protein VLB44_10565 [Kofleriaceae bacterium]|nr:hypothetical protein [Kofleriaceae bacterium]